MYCIHIPTGRQEDDPLPRREDRVDEGRALHAGLQGGVGGDEEVHRRFFRLLQLPLALLTVAIGRWR